LGSRGPTRVTIVKSVELPIDSRARLNCIAHILAQILYKKVDHAEVKLPARSEKKKYDDQASIAGRRLVMQRY